MTLQAWHAAGGLAMNFLESVDTIDSVDPIQSSFTDTCASWNAYYPANSVYLKDDSGI